ncbi:MAG: CatB-related O-acetyltransferase [Selenomonadaceae bacterium]|nr:CatB-related O-acetyltransferase [Selenomonadaceae bacterium]
MAYKTLIFGVDDLFNELKPFYDLEVHYGNLEIVAFAVIKDKNVTLVDIAGNPIRNEDSPQFQLAIISSRNNFYNLMKFLESLGFPRNRIIDGRVFKVPHFSFHHLMANGIAFGILEKDSFAVNSRVIYPQFYEFKNSNSSLVVDKKSYIVGDASIKGDGSVSVGKISSIAQHVIFSLGQNYSHNYKNISNIPLTSTDWEFPKEFLPPQGICKINIGSDVWIGRGCFLKSTNPKKPLVIGDGAVIASDSVVVKNVPPYAIVGGNPAQIIKYRFPPEVVESLLRIKWWDWSLDKIHDNFKYFNDIEKFISLHDK